ncbi:hypothetical protein SCP_1004560 [Sparassis crispa]|uniref:Fe2OG dioxygenase domain-containing protein n=1 Tax=Sparassis crispa TaxID=139825 RepID=A0A401GYF9_9APHY|nr:hypothetical protein SCP_1004560 [Sparassis crispa]GBE87209.1 hypothetical protein SCP_1004560 [Sparassis crispa]
MPLGGEGTHGRVDRKEGMYFGPEHPDDHRHTGMPLHGKNQFPDATIPAMRPTILQYIDEIVALGTLVCAAMSISLGLDAHCIRDNYLLPEPVALFRAFKYSPRSESQTNGEVWGIGEHSDFGLLTLLNHNSPGLQILSPKNEWVDVPVLDNAIVCNAGDMLDMITGGRFKSTRHRVVPPPAGTYRISFPFFFDFSWTANMVYLPLDHMGPLSELQEAEAKQRWASGTFKSVSGQWWQYLAKKVQKVFPEMQLPDCEQNAAASSRFCIAVPT